MRDLFHLPVPRFFCFASLVFTCAWFTDDALRNAFDAFAITELADDGYYEDDDFPAWYESAAMICPDNDLANLARGQMGYLLACTVPS